MARQTAPVNIRNPLLGALLLAAPALAGCAYLPPAPELPRNVFSTPIIPRGHAVSEEQIQQITPGVTTRSDVQALLGSPSQTSTFTDDNWYYFSSSTQLRPARTLAVRDERVVAINFNPQGTVAAVREIGQTDMPRVSFVSRETPTPGNDRSILQALFGNIGRFNAGPTGSGGDIVPTGGPTPNTGR
ncbi:outer membrane protein assembly factor BamE [Roseococcus sp. SYP-B2431]|uniref:outer membrane protein assembly factor BamE n=1 Tax=Roseococcus sp. SYP-B2431 TaxID=2496640 RepID=UPI00103E74DF|nr:outer membrane protein assembly factor BamE [Roseococcus sp. SYP-B2431]TCH96373.1 outer membrane protein assembly factor BamE [Roseococcus sp. SYP-B2431]